MPLTYLGAPNPYWGLTNMGTIILGPLWVTCNIITLFPQFVMLNS